MNFDGMITGALAFFIMGIFHPIVIKCEYYFTERIWPVFMALGFFFTAASVFIKNRIFAAGSGMLGCTFLWCIKELKEQTVRVEKGWFPANPKRAGGKRIERKVPREKKV